jgi:hypothetical protein
LSLSRQKNIYLAPFISGGRAAGGSDLPTSMIKIDPLRAAAAILNHYGFLSPGHGRGSVRMNSSGPGKA